MMLDKELQLASAVSVGTIDDAGLTYTTNAIDLWGAATATDPRTPIQGLNALEIDPSQGHTLFALFTVTTAITAADTAATVQFLIGDATAADGTNFSAKAGTPLITVGSGIAVGSRYKVPLSAAVFTQRYLVGAIMNEVDDGAGALTAGAFSCEIVIDNVTA